MFLNAEVLSIYSKLKTESPHSQYSSFNRVNGYEIVTVRYFQIALYIMTEKVLTQNSSFNEHRIE